MSAPANACSCSKCQGACADKPGWFKPEQIAPLAAAMGLTEKQLFDQYLQVDYWEDEDDIFVLSPAVVGGSAGDMFDRDPTGTCTWFKGGRCAIHELGKPFECAAYHHSDNDIADRHEAVAMAWKPHQDRIRELLGREPESSGSWGILDSLGLFDGW